MVQPRQPQRVYVVTVGDDIGAAFSTEAAAQAFADTVKAIQETGRVTVKACPLDSPPDDLLETVVVVNRNGRVRATYQQLRGKKRFIHYGGDQKAEMAWASPTGNHAAAIADVEAQRQRILAAEAWGDTARTAQIAEL